MPQGASSIVLGPQASNPYQTHFGGGSLGPAGGSIFGRGSSPGGGCGSLVGSGRAGSGGRCGSGSVGFLLGSVPGTSALLLCQTGCKRLAPLRVPPLARVRTIARCAPISSITSCLTIGSRFIPRVRAMRRAFSSCDRKLPLPVYGERVTAEPCLRREVRGRS